MDTQLSLSESLILKLQKLNKLFKTNQKRSRNEQSISLFLHFNLDTPVPHFATISYAFATRFPAKLFEEIFS